MCSIRETLHVLAAARFGSKFWSQRCVRLLCVNTFVSAKDKARDAVCVVLTTTGKRVVVLGSGCAFAVGVEGCIGVCVCGIVEVGSAARFLLSLSSRNFQARDAPNVCAPDSVCAFNELLSIASAFFGSATPR